MKDRANGNCPGGYGLGTRTVTVRERADDRVRHMRQKVRRLKAVASILHSTETFARPFDANPLAPNSQGACLNQVLGAHSEAGTCTADLCRARV